MFELQHFTQFILTKEKARCSISSNNNDLESEIISTSAPNRKAKSSLQPTVLRDLCACLQQLLQMLNTITCINFLEDFHKPFQPNSHAVLHYVTILTFSRMQRITGIPVYAHEHVQKTLEDLNWPICIDYRDLLARTNDASDRVPALLF
ncbi:hypothetical protein WN943_017818 [Citrus x changshan-huyou]